MKLRYKALTGTLAVVILAVAWLGWHISHNDECLPPSPPPTGTEMINAARHHCFGGPEVLALEPVEKPRPGNGEILVRVKAASVNPLDWHYLRGEPYIMRLMGAGTGTPSDPGLGADFAGVVEAVGSDASHFRTGDRVYGGGSGAFAEFVTIDVEKSVVKIPQSVSFEQAAGVPVAGITALQALRDIGKLEAGQKVLVNGASGGVGTFAVQIAKSMGAEVHGVCSTRNVEMVMSLGADRVIDYKNEVYTQGSVKYDLVVDMVGNHSLLANRKVMTESARLVIVGGSSGKWLGPLMRPLAALFVNPFVDQRFEMFIATMNRDDLATLAEMMSEGKLRTVVDQHFPLESIADAIRYSETGRARGKIIVDVAPAAGLSRR